MAFVNLTHYYKRFEKYISAIGLIYGFIFTSLTLTRVDTFLENFWIVLHLFLAGLGIALITYYKNKNYTSLKLEKIHFYLTLLIQFSFGGLFSTFFIFYWRSSSVAESWVFLFLLIILVVGNEIWKKFYTRLTFQVSVLFISFYLFLTFLLPVVFHRLGSDLFIWAGFLSFIGVMTFLTIIKKISKDALRGHRVSINISLLLILCIMNVLYFTNIIPPIPLSLKNTGVYHSVIRDVNGNYEVQAEASTWHDYFRQYPIFHRQVGEPVYVFSSVFSPVNFTAEIIHQWQYYDEDIGEWINSSRVRLPISGGRDNGFRTYSSKQSLFPGLWRVKVLTTSDQTIGNINFKVVPTITAPETYSVTLD